MAGRCAHQRHDALRALRGKGLKELQADADEVYDHIRDYVISALEDKPMMIYRSGAFVSDSDEWGRVRTVPCAGGDV